MLFFVTLTLASGCSGCDGPPGGTVFLDASLEDGEVDGGDVEVDGGDADGGGEFDDAEVDLGDADVDAGLDCGDAGFDDAGACITACAAGLLTCADGEECVLADDEDGFECQPCPEGFVGAGAGRGCADVDECLPQLGCGRGFSCVNTPGSFDCVPCEVGYDGPGYLPFCEDVNECLGAVCGAGSACVNTTGGHLCEPCAEGTTSSGDTPTCYDLDECARNRFECGEGLVCLNRPDGEGYSCESSCPPGYVASPTSACLDVDECALGTATCTTDESCTNTPGGFACSAPARLALGTTHTCALFENGTVKCWGARQLGVLGYGTLPAHYDVPPRAALTFAPGRRASDLVAGEYHSCVRFDDGSVSCWGLNALGQTGYGTDPQTSRPPFAPVHFGDGCEGGTCASATGVFAGGYASCATFDAVHLKCWGGSAGSSGYGADYGRFVPPASEFVDFLTADHFVTMSGGNLHSCGLLASGNVKCWGNNPFGASGYLVAGDRLYAPLDEPVDLGSDCGASGTERCLASFLETGYRHTCVVLQEGAVKCWGFNESGELGVGDRDRRNTPGPFAVLDGPAVRLAAGKAFTCALLVDGSVECWGSNARGQLGYGDNDARDVSGGPLDFGGRSAVELAAGGEHVCVILDDATVSCWGLNASGQLGVGGGADRSAPSAPLGLRGE